MTTDRFSRATGRHATDWRALMESRATELGQGIQELSHQEMVAIAQSEGATDWWAQGIAVEVERLIGRREVGQTVTGSINAGVSKTVPGEWREIFESFHSFMTTGGATLLPSAATGEPTTSATAKWRYWHCSFADGSKATLDCSDASRNHQPKARLSIKHDGLPSMADRDATKSHWKAVLNDFAKTLSSQ